MLATQEIHEIVSSCVSHGALNFEMYNRIQSNGAFHPASSVCIYGELLNVAKGNTLSSKWYAENVAGCAPGTLIGYSEIKIEKDGSYDISFQFQPPGGRWHPGLYRVKIYFDAALQADHAFAIKPG